MADDRPGEAFAAELSRLKRRGSAILVVSGRESAGVCRDLLGSDDEARRRVLVRADEFDELPVPGDDAVVVDATAEDARSAAAYDPGPIDRCLAGGCTVDTITTSVANEVEAVAGGGLEAGELRVCLGRLDPVVERADPAAVEPCLRDVFDSVRDARGMGHVHLSPDVAAGAVDRIRPAVDVTVHVRTTPAGVRKQRWRLHDAGIDTGWLQMRGP